MLVNDILNVIRYMRNIGYPQHACLGFSSAPTVMGRFGATCDTNPADIGVVSEEYLLKDIQVIARTMRKPPRTR